ncbi:MAG TPA: ATP-binding protein [Kineosporiaceae bacterium]
MTGFDGRSSEGFTTRPSSAGTGAIRVFSAAPSSVPEVRAWLGRRLSGLALRAETRDRAQLLVSELAANVVRHTTSDEFAVRLRVDDAVEVAVYDDDPIARPEPRRDPQPLDLGGRGLVLISGLADLWGVEITPTGKWVWFRIDPM